MKIFGLIGYPLLHSFSQNYFQNKFKKEKITGCKYENFQLKSIEDLYPLIQKNHELIGLNVTIPFKESVIPYLNEMDLTAKKIGAVNAVKIKRSGSTFQLKGFNTDHIGFKETLLLLIEKHHQKALVLGTGGASKAVCYVLNELKIPFIKVSRNKKQNCFTYDSLNENLIINHKIIINTTPLGTFPDIETFPQIPYEYLSKDHLLYDLVYNPDETVFLKNGKSKSARISNGYNMLKIQAEMAWNIWV